MISYLLLRNNKESGPYSLDQLVSHGLKPYDLVWINGKSAAWRYPGEITELKEFAPAVEEQPFDRFYKKPEASKKEEPLNAHQPVPVPEVQTSYSAKKSVFVTMPAQKQQQFVKTEQHSYPDYQQYQPSVKATPEPVTLAKTITITENPVSAETKYSQPLDEIKQMYVKTLQERKQKIAYKAFLLQTGKKVAVILSIVSVGVLIGFTIKSNGGKKQVAPTTINPQSIIPQQAPALPDTDMPIDQPVLEPEQKVETEQRQPLLNNEESKTNPITVEKTITEHPVQNRSVVTEPKKNAVVTKSREIPPVDAPSPGVNIDPSTGERIRKVRAAGEETTEPATEPTIPVNQPKAVMNVGLSKLVSVKSNDYKKVAFGGIRGLELTVYNDSKYLLDNVTVELQYLKPSEEPLKTETIQFRSISPGGSLTVRVPDTNRGIKVEYKITHILSTQLAKDNL